MLIFGLLMVILAIACGALMLWKIPWIRPAAADRGDLRTDGSGTGVHRLEHPGACLSVIIPARNEERRLAPLLDSLRSQGEAPLEIIVIDDQSTDATAAIAIAGGAAVVSTKAAAGWNGKSYACWTGAQAARGDLLLFLDADTRLAGRDSLRALLRTFAGDPAGGQPGRGILSVQPEHWISRLYENLSIVFNLVLMAGMNTFTPWSRPGHCAGAFGPCLLCRRDEYLRLGGHAAIRGDLLDDLALGSLFRQQGLPVRCVGGRGTVWFAMYPEGLGQLCEGWSKNFGSAAHSVRWPVMLMIIFWIGGAFSSVATLAAAFGAAYASPAWVVAAAFACLAYMAEFAWLARRVGRFHPIFLIAYPLPFVFFVCLFAWALFRAKILHVVSWRGRRIEV